MGDSVIEYVYDLHGGASNLSALIRSSLGVSIFTCKKLGIIIGYKIAL